MDDGSDSSGPARDQAVEILWHRHYAQLTRLAAGLTGDRGVAEEVVQDAFAGLLPRWRHLRDPDAAGAYLSCAVVNGARRRWRRGRLAWRAATLASPAQEAGPGGDVEARADMLAALARLPYGRRACLLLRYYADLTEVQVADLLGISVGTVKSQSARGLRQLEAALQETGQEMRRS